MPTRGWLFLVLPGLLQAQAALGKLYYTTPAGRAVTFKVVDAGPGRMSLAPETGDAEKVRAFVVTHAGSEARRVVGGRILKEPIPVAWKGGANDAVLLQNTEGIFWRYASGQVIPVMFQAKGQVWQLLSAELPPGRTFDR
jgi:hypothetical protein